jgi:hypothetical protein
MSANRLLKNLPRLFARQALAGRQRVLNEFTLERMWKETDTLYEQRFNVREVVADVFWRISETRLLRVD